ncbi:MAG: RNA polymerase sigma factor [Patescibacteria group bacterium]|nr:RNA polymerase sigma factor [Patescibacteria group bacterium]
MDIAQLVAEHHQALYRYAYRLTGTVADAEDLTQQAFLMASGKLGQLRDDGSAKSWLFAILRNYFLRQARTERPTPVTDLQLDIGSIPAAGYESEIDQERLQRVLDELPERYRVVLLMFYFEDLGYREMAEAINVPAGTIMSRLARAKSALRTRLLDAERAEESGRRQDAPKATSRVESS